MVLLAYYKARGLAQPIRFLLEYSGLEYEEKYFEFGPAPTYMSTEWMEAKEKMVGFDFPNVPYLIDGDTKLTQSHAIIHYLAEKTNLKPEKDKYVVEMLEGHIMDVRIRLGFLTYDSEFEKKKDMYAGIFPTMLRPLAKFLGDNKWICGDKVCYLDFLLYEALYSALLVYPDSLKDFPTLKKHQENIEALDQIKKYMASPRYIHRPWASPISKVGNE